MKPTIIFPDLVPVQRGSLCEEPSLLALRSEAIGFVFAARPLSMAAAVPWPYEDDTAMPQWSRVERMARLQAEVSEYEQLLVRLVTLFEAREAATMEHGRRVARVAVAMGADLGFDAEACHAMHRGALLHDIGLIALPDEVSCCATAMTPAVKGEIHSHPVVGYELLRGVASLEAVLPFVHRHHERFDGSGFPDGLTGSEIPMTVQIVSIADAWESLRSPRAYRRVMGHEAALEVIAGEARRGLWDPVLVEPLRRAVESAGVS